MLIWFIGYMFTLGCAIEVDGEDEVGITEICWFFVIWPVVLGAYMASNKK